MDKLIGIMPYVYFFDEPVKIGNVTFVGIPDWQGRNHAPVLKADQHYLQELSRCFSTTRGFATDKGVIKAITYFLLDSGKSKEAEIIKEAKKGYYTFKVFRATPRDPGVGQF